MEEFNGVYYNSLIYMTPFLIGIFFGYCKYNYEGKIKINLAILLIGSFHINLHIINFNYFMSILGSCSCVLLLIILLLNSFKMDNMSYTIQTIVANLSHVFMSLILLWCCVISMSNYGGIYKMIFIVYSKNNRTFTGWINNFLSSNFLQIVSKSYTSVILVHPLVSRIIVLSINEPLFISIQLIVSIINY